MTKPGSIKVSNGSVKLSNPEENASLYPELDEDLLRLQLSKTEEKNKNLAESYTYEQRMRKEYYDKYSKLEWSHRKAGFIALAIVVPVVIAALILLIWGYNNYDGGPQARQQHAIIQKQQNYASSPAGQCVKAGGHIVGRYYGNTEYPYCVFENGSSIKMGPE